MVRNVALTERIADRDIPILLQGETGVGKEVFAKAIHHYSIRHDGPFVAVNCAAIPESLLDSELFGYEPGTFTGGLTAGKTGKILASNGGTLFLDEIGDMPADLQGRLLRVLAEREVTPLGGVRSCPVDFALICATHRNLIEMVEAGHFRQDLYYRINGARIRLPPLREREDLAEMIHEILLEEAEACGSAGLSEAALSAMLSYSWPGNIRQLRNAIVFAILNCRHGAIAVDDLPEEIRSGDEPAPVAVFPPRRLVSLPLRETMVAAERQKIFETLQTTRWNVSTAAAVLGVSRATLHRRMREYAIERPGG